MRPIKIEEAVKAVNGEGINTAGKYITGVSIDSREELAGKTFFAVKGQNFDGHDFLTQVFDKNCALAVINYEYEIPEALKECCFIRVQDTKKALRELAKYYLGTLDALRIAVTGSVGKTTTREMLHAVLQTKYKTLRNIKNFNNDIGVPLSIFRAEEDDEAVVLEMGMSHEGEIRLLADIVRPQVAVITNIGTAHIDNLGGKRENILEAKWEVVSFFDEKSILVVNGDDELLMQKCLRPHPFTVIRSGEGADNDFRTGGIRDEAAGELTFTVSHGKETESFKLCVPGRHNGLNAGLAVAAGYAAGVSLQEAAAGLLEMRMEDKRLNIKKGKSAAVVIDDTYNANPASMRAALQVLQTMPGDRKIAVLGNMFELGPLAAQEHRGIGRAAAECGVDILLTIGENAEDFCEGARFDGSATKAAAFTDKKTLTEYLGQCVRPSDAILVKGSRAMKMEEITAYLTEE